MILFFVLFLLVPASCFADEVVAEASANQARFLVNAGFGIFLEEESVEQNFKIREILHARGGYVFDRGDAYYEYSRFTVTTGEGSVTIKRLQHIHLLWYRHWLKARGEIVPFVAGSMGAQANDVKTELAGQSVNSNGKYYLAGGLATGAFTTFGKIFEGGLEFRLLASETFRPNLSIGATAFLGFRF